VILVVAVVERKDGLVVVVGTTDEIAKDGLLLLVGIVVGMGLRVGDRVDGCHPFLSAVAMAVPVARHTSGEALLEFSNAPLARTKSQKRNKKEAGISRMLVSAGFVSSCVMLRMMN
jgi:hypothetical protein